MDMKTRDEIRGAVEKAKALIKLACDSYPRKQVVADLLQYDLEEKAYKTLTNELNSADIGANGPAKIGFGTTMFILALCGRPGAPAEALQWARATLDVCERLVGRIGFVVPRMPGQQFPGLAKKFGKLSIEVGEALQVFGEHAGDGQITRGEGEEILQELEDIHRVTAALEELVRREIAGEKCGGAQ